MEDEPAKQIVPFDDSEMNPAEAYPAIVAAWDQEEDPGLDAYQDLKRPCPANPKG